MCVLANEYYICLVEMKLQRVEIMHGLGYAAAKPVHMGLYLKVHKIYWFYLNFSYTVSNTRCQTHRLCDWAINEMETTEKICL